MWRPFNISAGQERGSTGWPNWERNQFDRWHWDIFRFQWRRSRLETKKWKEKLTRPRMPDLSHRYQQERYELHHWIKCAPNCSKIEKDAAKLWANQKCLRANKSTVWGNDARGLLYHYDSGTILLQSIVVP